MNRSRYLFSALSFLSALVVVACSDAEKGSSGSSGSGPENGNAEALPCDVDEILSTKCQTCHGASPKFGAPFPLAAGTLVPSAGHERIPVRGEVGEKWTSPGSPGQ